ncbi:efflux RND transporter periplasmic adaptor subunit [Planctomycetes bacterium K23_9]|uniref:Macrolide transporter subunit MacA n=1 Tax=Stieleria marina TaxID=1930275 RepID=A0A517NVP4_9BACT|nr:macrolide transporter subunit MacA [Planctomycetes bacterium K23_9]
MASFDTTEPGVPAKPVIVTPEIRDSETGNPDAKRTRPRSRRVEGSATDPSSVDIAELHSQLHHITMSKADEATVLQKIREIVMQHTGAMGVGLITSIGKVSDGNYNWELTQENSTGRLPRRADFVEKFGASCNVTVARRSIQLEHFLGVQAIYAPIHNADESPDVLLVLVKESKTAGTIFVLEIVNAYLRLYRKTHRSAGNDWKLVSLAALIELVSQIESQETVAGACEVAANELVRHLGARQVAIGTVQGGQLIVRSLSGTLELDPAGETYQAVELTLSESLLRQSVGVYPPAAGDESHLLVAHRQLCSTLQVPAVLTSPLTTPEGEAFGAILLTGDETLVRGEKLPNFVRASSPRIASAIEVVSRAQAGRVRQTLSRISAAVPSLRGFTFALIALLVIASGLMPVRYRVRSNCTTEPITQRFAVAPFQGLIEKGFAKPGDVVTEGQLLARMDGQSIRWELASVIAEQEHAAKKREIALADRNVTDSLLSQLDAERLAAQTKLLQHQASQVEIRSPIAGVVLSGSLERSDAAAVDTGEVIYEIAPLEKMKVEATIAADEITHVSAGQMVRIWIDGMSGQSFVGLIDRIHPRSELREGQNVFVATIMIDNQNDLLRPGMTGSVRIDCGKYPLAWNLFHGPWDYVASRMTWW